jgi:hypothetical protein
MTTERLTDIDKPDLQEGLTLSVIIGLFLVLAFAVILAIILGVATLLFGPPRDGLWQRALVVSSFSLLFFAHPFLIIIDLISGRKNIFQTSDYKLTQKNKKHFIKITDDRKTTKIEIDEDLIAKIDASKPLSIERKKASKM